MSASPPSGSLRRSYPWLPVLIVGMTIVAFVIGVVMLRSIEVRMIEAAGENATLAASEVADKLDRLLFERYGDVRMTARAFSGRPLDQTYLDEYLRWMKDTYDPVYQWLGVVDAQGRMVAATDQSIVGREYSKSQWFEGVRTGSGVRLDEVQTNEQERTIDSIAFSSPILGAKGEFVGAVMSLSRRCVKFKIPAEWPARLNINS
ncbi:MAG: hypothetical protein DYH04_12460 [Nitrospira sp. NTP2]|nr:hypothetical protein [Nitrospira sp. NTP2]